MNDWIVGNFLCPKYVTNSRSSNPQSIAFLSCYKVSVITRSVLKKLF